MSFLKSHIMLMFAYALATATFFTFLWKEGKQDRLKFFILVFCSLFVGGILVGWLMYPFPIK